MGHIGKNIKLFLFDPITTRKTPVSSEYMAELIGVSADTVSTYLYKKKPIHKIGCYLCKDGCSINELKELMIKWKDAETRNEIWKYTDDTKKYQVSSLGRVRKINKTTPPIFIMPYLNERSKGLFRIKLSFNNVYKEYLLHQIVAELFVNNDDPVNKTYVIHKNGIKTDNRANNLLYVTKEEACSVGGKSSFERKDSKEIIRREIGTGKELGRYNSLLEAEKDTGIKYQNIYDCIKGKRPTAGRSTWEYID